jgi:co-chaperonin GroES (HSP10)
MTRLQPLGSKILVIPITGQENHTTKYGIELVEVELSRASVVEVGTGVSEIFKKGDIVIFPKSRGTAKHYQGKPHLFIDGNPVNNGGDVWAIETTEILPKDKGDGL